MCIRDRIWANNFREAKVTSENTFKLRDGGIPGKDSSDGRSVEVVVSGLPICGGIPVAVDTTLVSVLNAKGELHKGVAQHP
eukprot:3826665-Karenia_brevis.AAC.1